MRRPWEKFSVVSNQVDVEYVDVLRRSHGVLVFEIGTRQKYPEVLSHGGWELDLVTSERTPDSQRNGSAEATSVLFPRGMRGWSLVIPSQGRYSLTAALYKPARRRSRDKMVPRTEEWRVRAILGDWS